jgi:hypothetical protein
MVGPVAQLCLFNQPRLQIGDSLVEVRPPLAFQVLVALALSKPRTLSRSEMAKSLFPGVDPKERRSQLRIVLSHLRRRFDEIGTPGVYRETGTDLHLNDAVTLDAHELVDGRALLRERLLEYSQPVLVGCQSRFADKCRSMVKNTVEASLPSILFGCEDDDELWEMTPVLSKLNALYPLSALICASHVGVLKRLHLYEESTQEIAEFETDWLEAYGGQDRPDIDAIVRKLALSDSTTSKGRS